MPIWDIDDDYDEDDGVDERTPEEKENDFENLEEDILMGEDDEDVICEECGAIVEDGIQCQICGLIVGI